MVKVPRPGGAGPSAVPGRRPRIAIVVSHPIQHFCPQYASLAKAGDWEICVFFASSSGRDAYVDKNFGARIKWGTLRLEQFPHVFLNDAPVAVSTDLDAPGLDQALVDFAPDVVVLYGYSQRYQRRARRVALSQGWATYFISDSELSGTRTMARRLARVVRARWHLRGVTRVLTVGDANERFYALAGVPADRMTRMGFPIDVGAFDRALDAPEATRAAGRARFGITPDEIVFGKAGKFIPIKRQADLIQAAARVDPALKIRVLLAGSGPEDAQLRGLAAEIAPDRVTFAGFVQPEDLAAFYAALDVYVHCSSHEPHSLAISEAIYVGLPVILSTSCGSHGPNDDVRPNINGRLYRTGAIDELASAMEDMARDAGTRTRFGLQSRIFATASQANAHGPFLRSALVADGLLPGFRDLE